jgi:hypothetical protein
MDGPPKAMSQASRHSFHGEDIILPKTSMSQRVEPHHHALPPSSDVNIKSGTFFPSWENRSASKGWARLSKS